MQAPQIDPASGNAVPPGALPKEVRDDRPIMASRICAACGVDKFVSEFSPNKDKPLGIVYVCKVCNAERAKFRRLSTPSTNEQKEAAKIRSRLWRKENPHKRNALKAAYKSAKVGATPNWLSQQQKEEINNFYFLARDCSLVSGENYQVDHIIPIRGKKICGLHVPWNLQILPTDLNRKKSNATAF